MYCHCPHLKAYPVQDWQTVVIYESRRLGSPGVVWQEIHRCASDAVRQHQLFLLGNLSVDSLQSTECSSSPQARWRETRQEADRYFMWHKSAPDVATPVITATVAVGARLSVHAGRPLCPVVIRRGYRMVPPGATHHGLPLGLPTRLPSISASSQAPRVVAPPWTGASLEE